MLYNSSIAAVKFLAREFSLAWRPSRTIPLNRDELSDHMLRDLGLLDGHALPENSTAHEPSRPLGLERLVHTRYGA